MTSRQYLRQAIRRARRYGLLVEFRAAYRSYRHEKVPAQEAAFWALNDWDLLDHLGEGRIGLVPHEKDR